MIAQAANRTAVPAAPLTMAEHAVKCRMADFLVERMASAGSVDRDDLRTVFTDAEIDRVFESAKGLARATSEHRTALAARNAGKARR